nr:phosphoenolpyruvate--protein phosphotransferase [Pseudovibrio flavus]
MIITNSDRVSSFEAAEGFVKAKSDTVLTVEFGAEQASESVGGQKVVSEAILIPNPTGLHARPAAVLANLAKKFESKVLLQRGDDQANAKSVVAIMGLNIEKGAKVSLIAEGPDAAEAIELIAPELANGLGDEGAVPAPAPATIEIPEDSQPVPVPRSDDPNLLLGVAAAPGLAVGKIFQYRRDEIQVPETGGEPNEERRRLDDAINTGKGQLQALQAELSAQSQPGKAAIFAAHEELLEDPELGDVSESAIAKGKSAEYAWKQAYTLTAERLAALPNEVLAARATDLRDVGRRVLGILTNKPVEQVELPLESVIIAEDLTPSDTAMLDKSRVVGICTVGGSATSHVSILARAFDIPTVAGIEPRAMDLEEGQTVILDGSKGNMRLNPGAEQVAKVKRAKDRSAVKKAADLAKANEPAITIDGHRVEVVANIGGLEEAQKAVQMGAEGVGLLRSEFLFQERAYAPTEDEQASMYNDIAEALQGRTLIIRTLDVGGDKPLPYLPLPKEENPFLGIRGVRLAIDRPDILRGQIRGILRVNKAKRLGMMFPMVSTLAEIRSLQEVVAEEKARVGRIDPIEIGIMVEVPSAALMAEQFAAEVDFFSIGTNDLTQYTMAIDRGHPKLAKNADAMNPAVLRLIAQTVEGAKAHGKWVGVCGGIAGDPRAVPILVGLGLHELSVSVPAVPAVKAAVRNYTLQQCQELAEKALKMDSAADVRALVPEED